MAMATEFVFTPWPASPFWPFFQLSKRRVPARPEPSLVDLALLACIAAPLAAAFQVFFSIAEASACWEKDNYDEGEETQTAAAAAAAAAGDVGGRPLTDFVQFSKITRCREVGQSLLGLPLRFLHAFFSSLIIVFRTRPRLVLLNGPGTCLPLAAAAFLCEVRLSVSRCM
ncbi:hypothetical protein Emed_004098 [Eimeria media]